MKRFFIFISVAFILTSVHASELEQKALAKIDTLNSFINELKIKGIDVQTEELAVQTAKVFLFYANWDEANVDKNTAYNKLHWYFRDDAAQLAQDLPDFERNDIIKLLDESIAYAKKLKNEEVFRKASPKINWAQVTLDEDQLTFSGKPVFLGFYTWKLSNAGTYSLKHFGDNHSFFISPSYVTTESGTINTNVLNDLKTKPSGNIGSVFVNHNSVPGWAKQKFGDEFTQYKGEPFIAYDIDHPGAKEMYGKLLDGTVKYMAGKNYAKLGYMICNEPRWINYKDGDKKVWYSTPVSEYTMAKFRTWLSEKHENIATLNQLWGTNFEHFDSVKLDIPIDISLIGTPQWYDYNTFNDYRALEYFTWMKQRLLQNDPHAKMHLKIMPSFFTDNDPCTGIDLEALTEISDINGNDCATQYNLLGKIPEWETHYILGWRELWMGYDFLKSVQPNHINYNSESHLLSTNHSRDLHMKPEYARAVYWAAHTLGMNASQTWYWPRREDGSVRTPVSNGYTGSNNQQPRVTNEVHATLLDLNRYAEEIMAMQRQRKPLRLFYSKTSAHQRSNYMDDQYAVYEALNFEGIPLGFATKNIIARHDDSNWDAIMVYKTDWITQAELDTLQGYLNNGGTIILETSSLKKDEYGRAVATLEAGNGTLLKVSSLSELKTKALELMKDKNRLPEVSLIESNTGGHKGCTWKCVKNAEGNNVLSIVNLGKTDANLKIALKNATKGTKVIDLLKGIEVNKEPTLKPYEVLFIEILDEEPTQTGIRKPSSKINMATMYPSITNGAFSIKFNTPVQEVSLKLFAMDGSLHFQKKYQNTDIIHEQLKNSLDGVYLVQLDANVGTQVFKLVKQN